MIKREDVPEEAIEAAEEAIMDELGHSSHVALVAIVAALNAWPGAAKTFDPNVKAGGPDYQGIYLPLGDSK